RRRGHRVDAAAADEVRVGGLAVDAHALLGDGPGDAQPVADALDEGDRLRDVAVRAAAERGAAVQPAHARELVVALRRDAAAVRVLARSAERRAETVVVQQLGAGSARTR